MARMLHTKIKSPKMEPTKKEPAKEKTTKKEPAKEETTKKEPTKLSTIAAPPPKLDFSLYPTCELTDQFIMTNQFPTVLIAPKLTYTCLLPEDSEGK